MADVNEVRGIEQQQGQGAYNPNLYAENNLDVRLEQQPWQAQANANAQRFVPTFEESGTNNGANKYAPQQNPVMMQDNNKVTREQKLDRDRPPQPRPDKLDTTDAKYGSNSKGAGDKKGALDNKANYKSGEAERKAEVSPSEPKEHMDKLPADSEEPDGKEHMDKLPADSDKEGEEHMDKLPADANKEGEEHMDKLPADATEDESAGSFGGSGDSTVDGERTPRDRERERAKEVFESIGGTAAPRTFNSVGEAATEALKVLRHQ